jgi:hypothetical protein
MNFRVTATKGLYIRSGPGAEYESVGVLADGDIVISPDTAGWLPILLEDNSIGWVARQYLEEALERVSSVDESVDRPVDESVDFSTREGTIEAIKAECQKQGLGLATQIAYVLATTEWETGRTFKPVKEAYWKDEEWRRRSLARYYPYYGRGFVQLTWESNYRKYSPKLTQRFGVPIDLVKNPDDAMKPEYALFILVDGFRTGAFTGKKITDYINDEETDFHNARRCINALDKADEIAALAEKYLEAA